MYVVRRVWELRPIWVTLVAFLAPLFLVFVEYPDIGENVQKCLYVIIVMAQLWVTEAIPIPVTALLPIILFPMLNVASARVISASYISDTTMLFLGGLIIAVGLEESGLHVRISMGVMVIVGAQPIWLMFGLMLTTWFLSMWISNTAATAMMIPIIRAVIKTSNAVNQPHPDEEGGEQNIAYEMDDVDASHVDVSDVNESKGDVIDSMSSVKYENNGNVSREPKEKKQPLVNDDIGELSDEMERLAKGFSLCVAYGANIGGIATLTGTPPNLVLKNQADKIYKDFGGAGESPISFAKWMGFAFPMSLICLTLAWLWLSVVFVRGGIFRRMNPQAKKAVTALIRKQYNDLGRISFVEVEVLVVFVLLVIFWLFRAPPNIDGWGIAFEKEGDSTVYVSDSTPCILIGILLFILPANMPVFVYGDNGLPFYKPILTWKVVAEKLPWGVIILLGGGFAIAKAAAISGLAYWIGEQMVKLAEEFDMWVFNMIICFIVAALTEVTSNTATATLLMPILSALAISAGTHPLYMMISSGIACSFAFMFPVATPPNAIVFATGYLKIRDMIWVGFVMNIIAIGCITLSINTWGKAMFEFDDVPHFFQMTTPAAPNGTTVTTLI